MQFPLDVDSPLSNPSREHRSNARQQRRKLKEGESSRTGDLAAHVEQRAYNMRPQNVDPVIMQRGAGFDARCNRTRKGSSSLKKIKKRVLDMRSEFLAVMNRYSEASRRSNPNSEKTDPKLL